MGAIALVALVWMGCSAERARNADDDDGSQHGSGGSTSSAAGAGGLGQGSCEPNPCQNDGVCSDAGDGPTCACALGFTGPDCTLATGFIAVSGGYKKSGALRADGSYWWWGSEEGAPNHVEGLPEITAVAPTDPSVLTSADGHAWLVFGWTHDATGPAPAPNLSGVVAVSSDVGHSLALRSDGTVWAWGANSNGQLGDGTTTPNWEAPKQVLGLTGIVAVAAAFENSFALQDDGTVWAWGDNFHGEVCDGTHEDRLTPTPIFTGAKALAATSTRHVLLKEDGTLWECDGYTHEQVNSVPSGIVSIATGGSHTLALRDDGTVWAWGRNYDGQLGDGTTEHRETPVPVVDLSEVATIAAGDDHSLAVKADGTVWAWGRNVDGELGTDILGEFNTFPQRTALPEP